MYNYSYKTYYYSIYSGNLLLVSCFQEGHAKYNMDRYAQYAILENSLIIHEENTKKNHKRVVSVYVIQIHVDLYKL
jgi:hypothetical protein